MAGFDKHAVGLVEQHRHERRHFPVGDRMQIAAAHSPDATIARQPEMSVRIFDDAVD